MSWVLVFSFLYHLSGSSKSEATLWREVSWELRVTTTSASHCTSRVSSTGLVIELGPIDSPVIIRQIRWPIWSKMRAGGPAACQELQGTGLYTGLPPSKLIKAWGLSWNGALGGGYLRRGPYGGWAGQLKPDGAFRPWHNHPGWESLFVWCKNGLMVEFLAKEWRLQMSVSCAILQSDIGFLSVDFSL